MSGQEKAAEIAGSLDRAFNEFVNQVAREHPSAVLLLDDDEELARATFERFHNSGVRIVHARSTEEADVLLSREEFSAAIIDHNLGGEGTGEEWALKNNARLMSIPTFVLTGLIDQLRHRPELRRNNVKVVPKGTDDEEDVIWLQLGRFAFEHARYLVQAYLGGAEPLGGPPMNANLALYLKEHGNQWRLGTTLQEKSLQLFRQWLGRFRDQKSALLYVGDESFSAEDLLREALQNTEMGRQVIGLFVDELSARLRGN